MPLVQTVLQKNLFELASRPSASQAEAAQRFSRAIETWAMSAMAMGVPAVLPPSTLLQSGIMAGTLLPVLMNQYWLAVVFPGAVGPAIGPPMAEAMTLLSADAMEASSRLASSMQIHANSQIVTFLIGGIPTPFPIV